MTSVALDYETLTDIELARRIAQRDSLAVRIVTRRNNQRLYRTAWSVLKNRADAEDARRDISGLSSRSAGLRERRPSALG